MPVYLHNGRVVIIDANAPAPFDAVWISNEENRLEEYRVRYEGALNINRNNPNIQNFAFAVDEVPAPARFDELNRAVNELNRAMVYENVEPVPAGRPIRLRRDRPAEDFGLRYAFSKDYSRYKRPLNDGERTFYYPAVLINNKKFVEWADRLYSFGYNCNGARIATCLRDFEILKTKEPKRYLILTDTYRFDTIVADISYKETKFGIGGLLIFNSFVRLYDHAYSTRDYSPLIAVSSLTPTPI